MILPSAEDPKPNTSLNRAVEMDIHEVRRWTSELTVLVVEDDQVLRESSSRCLAISLQKLMWLLMVRMR